MLEDRSVYRNMNVNELKPHPSKAKTNGNAPALTEKKMEKVVTGKVKTKKSEIRKFTDIFIAEDIGVVKDYVVNDLVIPWTKDLIGDILHNTVDMLFFGKNSGRSSRSRSGSGRRADVGHVSYRSYYDDKRDREERRDRSNSRFTYDDIVFDSRIDAENVLEQMKDIIDTYDLVRVLDLYDLAGVSPAPHTGHNFGWTNLSRAYVDRVRDGYIIKLPKPVAID